MGKVTFVAEYEGGFTGGRWCTEDREGYANDVSDCIEEMERLYNIK